MTEQNNDEKLEDDGAAGGPKTNRGVPLHMRPDFGQHEGATAQKPGFRNPGNKNSKAQKRKKKGRK